MLLLPPRRLRSISCYHYYYYYHHHHYCDCCCHRYAYSPRCGPPCRQEGSNCRCWRRNLREHATGFQRYDLLLLLLLPLQGPTTIVAPTVHLPATQCKLPDNAHPIQQVWPARTGSARGKLLIARRRSTTSRQVSAHATSSSSSTTTSATISIAITTIQLPLRLLLQRLLLLRPYRNHHYSCSRYNYDFQVPQCHPLLLCQIRAWVWRLLSKVRAWVWREELAGQARSIP